jgi:MFS family permease
MTPMLGGFAVFGPVSGWLSDRLGSRLLATVGMVINVVGFIGLTFLPADFPFGWFAFLLVVLGAGQGLFAAPNTTAIMNSLPPEHRGVGSGMRATLMNSAMLLSIGVFFSVVIAALAHALPPALSSGLTHLGLSPNQATKLAQVPPTAALFAAFLGYNPMSTLMPASMRQHLSPASQAQLLSTQFFPSLIGPSFMLGLRIAFYVSAGMAAVAAVVSLLRGRPYVHGAG